MSGGCVLSARGIIHRIQPDGSLHARCTGGREVTGIHLTIAQALRYAKGRTAVYCRYRWCFREALVSAGIDPEVGHFTRSVKPPTPAQLAEVLAA